MHGEHSVMFPGPSVADDRELQRVPPKELKRLFDNLCNPIGLGTFSKVFKLDNMHAVKVIRVGGVHNVSINRRHALKEIQIMTKL